MHSEGEHLEVIREAARSSLPSGWRQIRGPQGKSLYLNSNVSPPESTGEHPFLTLAHWLVEEAKVLKKQLKKIKKFQKQFLDLWGKEGNNYEDYDNLLQLLESDSSFSESKWLKRILLRPMQPRTCSLERVLNREPNLSLSSGPTRETEVPDGHGEQSVEACKDSSRLLREEKPKLFSFCSLGRVQIPLGLWKEMRRGILQRITDKLEEELMKGWNKGYQGGKVRWWKPRDRNYDVPEAFEAYWPEAEEGGRRAGFLPLPGDVDEGLCRAPRGEGWRSESDEDLMEEGCLQSIVSLARRAVEHPNRVRRYATREEREMEELGGRRCRSRCEEDEEVLLCWSPPLVSSSMDELYPSRVSVLSASPAAMLQDYCKFSKFIIKQFPDLLAFKVGRRGQGGRLGKQTLRLDG